MNDKNFFTEQSEQSRIKTEIVSKYFLAWAKVMIASLRKEKKKIEYIDLFAGPGTYEDGTLSTPLIVLQKAIEDDSLRESLATLFNDGDRSNAEALKKSIKSIEGIEKLRYKPVVSSDQVGENIVRRFQSTKLVPSLIFIDPWGYKGLSLSLINAVIKDWGCDCIFFFNYNRVNMGLNNPIVEEHMNELFGEARAVQLREKLLSLDSQEKELVIVEELTSALKHQSERYVLPFRFCDKNGARTSHHLIFVTKHIKGYEIMKGIMAKASSDADQGVPSFTYNPASVRQPLLFEFTRPLEELADMLLNEYAGKTISVKDIYEEHSVGRKYMKKNYVEVLQKLDSEKKIVCSQSIKQMNSQQPMLLEIQATPSKSKKNSFGDNVEVTFPKK